MIAVCPSDETLRRYSIGDVDDAICHEIESHLTACPACEETIAQFDSADDTLMRHLPLAAAGNASDESTVAPGWLEQMRKGPGWLGSNASDSPPGDSPGANYRPNGDTSEAQAPESLAAYELQDVLGRGGMGVVYRARHRQLNRPVALKVLSPRLMSAPEARRRFEREIQVLGGLHHPGIVMATDAGRIGEAAYLVMELVDGIDLARLVRQGGPLSIAEACEVTRQMADALAAAHEAGAVHRDVKPSNAMVDRRGRVKLLDFGLAHLHTLSTESLETSLGRLLGTLDYMAPEQAGGEQSPGPSADLYGLGATLFFLLTGRPPHGPHAGRSLVLQLRALVDAEAPRVSTLRADVPPALDDFVAQLLSRAPSDRPASAEVVAAELAKWTGGDLKARVAEAKLAHAPDEQASTNSELALQSLSELVGPEFVARPSRSGAAGLGEQLQNPAGTAGLYGGGRGRRGLRWLAGAAAFAAAIYGVVIVLRTPDGELRIVSQVDDPVEVTIVDNDNKPRGELTVDRQGHQTTLRAGQYQVLFKTQTTDLKIDPSTVVLQRGQTTIATITRNPATAAVAVTAPDAAPTAKSAEAIERTYNGKSESEWRRIYLAETYSTAKLEAANALFEFAARMPPEKQLDEILNIGEEYVRASVSGTNYMSFAITRVSLPAGQRISSRGSSRGGRGGRGGGQNLGGGRGGPVSGLGSSQVTRGGVGNANADLFNATRTFQTRLRQLIRDLPAEPVIAQLCKAAGGESEPRAAFALAVLREYSPSFINATPAVGQIVMRELKTPSLVGSDRTDALLLTQFEYLQSASGPDRQEFNAALQKWVDRLAQNRRASNRYAIEELMRYVREYDNWPIELRQSLAKLVFGLITDQPTWASVDNFFSLAESEAREFQDGGEEIVPPYDKRYLAAARKRMQYFLDQWPQLANQYLENHQSSDLDISGNVEIIRTLESVLPLYSDGDNWPVDKSAAILTERLKSHLDPKSKPANPSLLESPAELLAQIVQLTGKIPETARTAAPHAATAEKLKDFEAFLAGERDKFTPDALNYFAGLYEWAPLEVIKLSLGETKKAPIQGRRGVYTDPLTPRFILALASTGGSGHIVRTSGGDPPPSYVDPVLLLTALSNLTGASETQDARIATLLNEQFTGWGVIQNDLNDQQRALGLRGHIRNLLASPLQARFHARRILDEMAAKAKSSILAEAVKSFGPAAAEIVAPPKSESPVAASDSADRLYQGKPASEWQRLLVAEIEPKAKLEAGKALLLLATQYPAAEQVDRMLAVGEEFVRSKYGNRGIEMLGDPEFLSIDVFSDVMTAFEKLPVHVVAERLAHAVVHGSNPRAALAAMLLQLMPKLPTEPAAAQLAFQKLDVPLTGLDRSALCLLLRANFAKQASADERGKLARQLTELAIKLLDAPPSTFWDYLVGYYTTANTDASLPRERQLLSSKLVLKAIVEQRPNALHRFFWIPKTDMRDKISPYEAKWVAMSRRPYTDQWLAVANEYLKTHRTPPFNAATRDIARSLDATVQVYSDGDNWPASETATLLTDLLRPYYTDGAAAQTDQTVEDLLPASPALILTQIVRLTGKLPEFVVQGRPRSRPVLKRLSEFDAAFAPRDEKNNPSSFVPSDADFSRLFDQAPYEVIRRSLEDLPRFDFRWRSSASTTALQLASLGTPKPISGAFVPAERFVEQQQEAPVDPLLALACLEQLAGQDETRDDRIAGLLSSPRNITLQPVLAGTAHETTFAQQLKDLLASPLVARKHAGRMLAAMAAKTKSQALLEVIRSLGPAAAEVVTPPKIDPPVATTSSADAAERLYKGKPISEWPRVFAAETDPAAKLDAAAAVLKLLPEPLGEKQIDTILEVGEVIVRESFGNDAPMFAFQSGTSPPSGERRWNFTRPERRGGISGPARQMFGQSNENAEPALLAAYGQFLGELNPRVAEAPAELLAVKLTEAAVKGPDARAAFALSLLRNVARKNIYANPAAAQIVVDRLKTPSRALDRSANLLLTRANYAAKSPNRREKLAEVASLGEAVLDAPRGGFRDAIRRDLLSFGESTNAWPEDAFRQDWPATTQKILARLVLDEMTGPNPQQPGRMYVDVPNQPQPAESADGFRTSETLLSGYDPRYPVARRAGTRYFLNEWLPVANEYLKSHAAPYDDSTKNVFYTTTAAIDARMPADNWPAEATAALLTEQLRSYYVTDTSAQTDQAVTDQGAPDREPLKPENLLQTIAHITGDVPDFARTGLPKSKTAADRLQQFEAALGGEAQPIERLRQLEGSRGRRGGAGRGAGGEPARVGGFVELYADAPFQVIKLAVKETTARLPLDRFGRGGRGRGRGADAAVEPRDILIRPSEILRYATSGSSSGGGSSSRGNYPDPMFLLTALAKLAGESEAQDERIADLLIASLPYFSNQVSVHVQLKSLIGGPTKTGQIARQLLVDMAAKTKSRELIRVIRLIDASIEPPAGAAQNAPAENNK